MSETFKFLQKEGGWRGESLVRWKRREQAGRTESKHGLVVFGKGEGERLGVKNISICVVEHKNTCVLVSLARSSIHFP